MTVKAPRAIYEECSVHGRAKPKHRSVKELLFLKQLLGPHFQGRKTQLNLIFQPLNNSGLYVTRDVDKCQRTRSTKHANQYLNVRPEHRLITDHFDRFGYRSDHVVSMEANRAPSR